MNTRIEYLYRDGANWKAWGHVVVAGALSFEEVRPFLIDDLWFTPAYVSLPHPGATLPGFPNSDDHFWCELTPESFTPCSAPAQIAAADLLARFAAAARRVAVR